MGIRVSDISRMGPAAQKQIMDKLREKRTTPQSASQTAPLTRDAKSAAKYHNVKAVRVMPNGEERVFDSQKEARRYDELIVLLRAGQIRELKLQPQFTLQESYITAEGNRVRAIRYVADFAYVWTDTGEDVVEDVKSKATETRVYKVKKKLMQEKFGISVKEI